MWLDYTRRIRFIKEGVVMSKGFLKDLVKDTNIEIYDDNKQDILADLDDMYSCLCSWVRGCPTLNEHNKNFFINDYTKVFKKIRNYINNK